ncbi:MAG: leucyl/phenylalanyl-tRNA--protein transferase [Bdellovibrionaceae bacterium]|nr:leucyl/phenylalanyl-tRNA--protein transferase [Pseudobdellovibrionaceae bacterium]
MNILSPSRFPNPRKTDPNGIVAVGGDLEVDTLVDAYAHGIFPWPHKDYPLLWFSPVERGVLFFKELHLSRSLNKWLKKTKFKTTFNKNFKAVIEHCATRQRPGQNDTWVTPEMMSAYLELHHQGFAHSVECWNEGQLVGGLYGVYIAGVFSAESMFFLESGASKYCLLALLNRLHLMGHAWVDTQMVSEVVEAFGGRYVAREEYLKILKEAQEKDIPWSGAFDK